MEGPGDPSDHSLALDEGVTFFDTADSCGGRDASRGFALAGGMAERILTDANFDTLEALKTYAKASDRSLLELAVAWLASQPQVSSVIAGATRPERVTANVQACDWRLDAIQLAEIHAITRR